MKLLAVKCPSCGGKLEIKPDDKTATCQYCNCEFIIDDEAERIQIENAEQAGYEFEKGRQRAKQEAEKENYKPTHPPVLVSSTGTGGSGCVLILFGVMIVWLAFCTFCGFIR